MKPTCKGSTGAVKASRGDWGYSGGGPRKGKGDKSGGIAGKRTIGLRLRYPQSGNTGPFPI